MRYLLLALLLIASPVQAGITYSGAQMGSIDTSIYTGNTMTDLFNIGGLAFYKNFIDSCTPNATDYAAVQTNGSSVGTYTRSSSASFPSTWIDSTGKVNVSTTSNEMLCDYGYWDSTGFTAKPLGYHAYRQSTNLLTYTDGTAYASGLWTGWSYSGSALGVVTSNESQSILNIPSSLSQRIYYDGVTANSAKSLGLTGLATAVGSVVQNDTITLSFLMKVNAVSGITTMFGQVNAVNAAGGALTAYTQAPFSIPPVGVWTKLTYTVQITDATASRVTPTIKISNQVDTGDISDFEIAEVQLEKMPYATPFIPTTTAALTRNADVLKYLNLGNSRADEETIIIGFTPGSTFANDGNNRFLYDVDTKRRYIQKAVTGNSFISAMNADDDSTKIVTSSNTPSINTQNVFSFVSKHSSPYGEVYANGVSVGTYTSLDWTNNAFGQYLYLGSSRGSIAQLDGNIAFVIKFQRALTAQEISRVQTIMAGYL